MGLVMATCAFKPLWERPINKPTSWQHSWQGIADVLAMHCTAEGSAAQHGTAALPKPTVGCTFSSVAFCKGTHSECQPGGRTLK